MRFQRRRVGAAVRTFFDVLRDGPAARPRASEPAIFDSIAVPGSPADITATVWRDGVWFPPNHEPIWIRRDGGE